MIRLIFFYSLFCSFSLIAAEPIFLKDANIRECTLIEQAKDSQGFGIVKGRVFLEEHSPAHYPNEIKLSENLSIRYQYEGKRKEDIKFTYFDPKTNKNLGSFKSKGEDIFQNTLFSDKVGNEERAIIGTKSPNPFPYYFECKKVNYNEFLTEINSAIEDKKNRDFRSPSQGTKRLYWRNF